VTDQQAFSTPWLNECTLFRLKRRLKTITDFQINCNGHLIKSQSSIKYLGIDIYPFFSGERTANIIITMVNSRLKLKYRYKIVYLLIQEVL